VTGPGRDHLPPAGRRWLLPLYDPVSRLLGVEAVHRRLLASADVRPGHRVLEIGCGTGDLALLAKAEQPAASVVGLDPDLPALTRARRKARRRGVTVQWDHGVAGDLPYPDASVDRVLSAFMLHHVPDRERERALREVLRVLRPGGELHLVDFGGQPAGSRRRWGWRPHRHTHQVGADVTDLLRSAGFSSVSEAGSTLRLVGPVTSYRAVR
jgi:ubiquinone/menaquinone biosynthesis C-methylase UbiE